MPIRDTRMMVRALTQRWDIKPEYRDAVIKRLVRIVADPASKPREVTAAAKGLMAAESQNQLDQHKFVDVHIKSEHNRLDAIAADLGIDPSVIESAEKQAGRSNRGDETEGSQ